jgi:glycosyltransferase involved in cell wall biosynthesis
MPPLSLPSWIKPHLFPNKKFKDLTRLELTDLKARLARFQSDTPEVSVVIPAWNEADNIYRTLSSLAANDTTLRVEIVVINNNSTDQTQQVLDELGVRSFHEHKQGISFTRQKGLEEARGRYHLCADADTFYPPQWIELMTKPMRSSSEVTGVYGRYSFLPPAGRGRGSLWLYELCTSVLFKIRQRHREFVNVLGFNMGLVTEIGREAGGFHTTTARTFNNESNVLEAEDGWMAIRLKTRGRLQLVTDPKALVFTSPRKLLQDGGIFQAFSNRLKGHTSNMAEYLTGQKAVASS